MLSTAKPVQPSMTASIYSISSDRRRGAGRRGAAMSIRTWRKQKRAYSMRVIITSVQNHSRKEAEAFHFLFPLRSGIEPFPNSFIGHLSNFVELTLAQTDTCAD